MSCWRSSRGSYSVKHITFSDFSVMRGCENIQKESSFSDLRGWTRWRKSQRKNEKFQRLWRIRNLGFPLKKNIQCKMLPFFLVLPFCFNHILWVYHWRNTIQRLGDCGYKVVFTKVRGTLSRSWVINEDVICSLSREGYSVHAFVLCK